MERIDSKTARPGLEVTYFAKGPSCSTAYDATITDVDPEAGTITAKLRTFRGSETVVVDDWSHEDGLGWFGLEA